MDKLHVFKIGGNIIDNESKLISFLKDFSALKESKILIHGGGKEASSVANQLGIPVKLHNGRRITDALTLNIITMVFAGKINKSIVSELQAFSCNSIGICGADGNAYKAIKRPKNEFDFGFVGDLIEINTSFFKNLLDNKIIPDPFFSQNEAELQWISKKDWTYKLLFEPDKDEKRSRDYNHLLLMCNYSGKFKKKYLKKTKHYKKFFTKNGDFRHDNICSEELIEVLMENGVEDDDILDLVDLMKNIFVLDPNKRFDAKKVLGHKWLNS